LYVLAETIRHLGIYIQPFMPDSAAKMLNLLAVPENARNFAHVGQDYALVAGATLPKPEAVFPRLVDEEA
jgi:methionyl-tRNA synthetase